MCTTPSLFAAAALLASVAQADVYLHAGPGSNNRLDEENRERNNANRLFDSQNNNRGGYNVGKLRYYPGEKVQFSWTNQHGSSKYQMEHTELILQYMCEPLIRDGTTTNTIPDKPIDCQNFDCDTDVRYGRHESYEFYQRCKQTERNKGLFTANQNLKGNAAKYTRQNPNGNRSGYECPEERDYYPYWRPTPWKDIAYITNDIERCEQVTAESQNVKGRNWCTLPDEFYANPENKLPNGDAGLYPITKEACEAWTVTGVGAPKAEEETEETGDDDEETGAEAEQVEYTGVWKEFPAWGLEKPACVQSEQTRANHLGVIGGRTQYSYQFTVPADIGAQSRCTTRMRYNITTAEYDAWEAAKSVNAGLDTLGSYNRDLSEKNSPIKPNAGNNPANVDLWSRFGIAESEVKKEETDENGNPVLKFYNGNNNGDKESREYVLKNNPQVELMKMQNNQGEYVDFPNNFKFKLQLAVNTAQFGRTFQDRMHAWQLRELPEDIDPEAEIKLVTVSGKRGNIVQTFPAHEYFFIPEETHVQQNDLVHFMWTGSNTNPNNNDGQGKQGTDRSNIVPLRVPRYSRAARDGVPKYSDFAWDSDFQELNSEPVQRVGETSDPGTSYPAFVMNPEGYEIPEAVYEAQPPYGEGVVSLKDNLLVGALGGLSASSLAKLATGRFAEHDDFGNMEELDDASTGFDMPLQKMTDKGCWNFLSTRNNNFSNRSQKGKLCVTENSVETKMVGSNGGEVWTKHGDGLQIWPDTVSSVQTVRFSSRKEDDTDLLMVQDVDLQENTKMTLYMRYQTKSLHHAKVMHRCLDADRECTETGWNEVDDVDWEEKNDNNMAVVNHNMMGEYKVIHEANAGAIAGIVIGTLVFACAIVAVIVYQFRGRCRGDKTNGEMDV